MNVNSLSSTASKSYKAFTFLPSGLEVVAIAAFTLGYRVVAFFDVGVVCKTVDGLEVSFNDNSIAANEAYVVSVLFVG